MSSKKPIYEPGQYVWFHGDDGYDYYGIIDSRPIRMDGQWHMQVKYIPSGKWLYRIHLINVSQMSDPIEPIQELPDDAIKNKIKGLRMKLNKSATVTLIVLAVIAIVGLWGVGNYNSLVGARNAVDNSKAKIDTQLTRRYELIDNIVQSVQGSQAQESDVFGKIAEARKIGGSTNASTEDQAKATQTIDTQIALLPRLQEAYPELRSNDQVSKLITELQGTSNGIRDARDNYNNVVTNYNTNVTRFPKSLFAGIFNFDKAKLFEASAQERINPKVELDREKN